MTLPPSIPGRPDEKPPTILPRRIAEPHLEPASAVAPRPKVKRGRKNVSRACQACRQRRIRCTVERPCQPCRLNNLDCEDDDGPEGVDLRTVRLGPQNQKVFIQQKTLLDSLLQLIRDDNANNVLQCIKEGGSLVDIAQALKDAEGLPQSSRMADGESDHHSHEVEEKSEWVEQGEAEAVVTKREDVAFSVESFGNLPVSSAIKANGFSPRIQDQQILHMSKPVWECVPLISDEASTKDVFSLSCMSFRNLAREQIANGASAELILSLDGIEMDLLFRERTSTDPHTVSTWACGLLKTFDFLHPVIQLAAAEAVACLMRWLICPTKENYLALPASSRPIDSQYFVPHSIGADIMMLPEVREVVLARDPSAWTDIITSTTMEFNWPYSVDACLELATRASTGHGVYMRLSKAFVEHIRDLNNLSMDSAVVKLFPEFEGKYRVHNSGSNESSAAPSKRSA